ncbi:hypothetical protein M9458_030147, partial [Cirrhinus mrigala]
MCDKGNGTVSGSCHVHHGGPRAPSLAVSGRLRETDKTRFLNGPVSQTGLFGDRVENFSQQFSAAQKQAEAIRHILPRCAAAASTRPPPAAPQPACRRGRPPACAPAPTQPSLQPSQQRRGAHSPSPLASERQWAVGECYQTYYSHTICPNAGKCLTHSRYRHSDPASVPAFPIAVG